MSRPDQHQQLGRTHQRPGLLTAGQVTALIGLAATLGLLTLWHLTLVLTAGIPLTGFGITRRGLLAASPLDLPVGYDPAGAGVPGAVFVLLCAAAVGLLVWWAVRAPARRRRRRTGVGLADRQQTRRSAGEIRVQHRRTRKEIDFTATDSAMLPPSTTPQGQEQDTVQGKDTAGVPA